ncbi:MAG: GNAT family N-acetyltransferase [bacterium]|nr:GNAT family N-acetyltransferase [bacterium]
MSDQIELRLLGTGHVDAVQLALYLAVSWSNPPEIPDLATAIAHPEVAMYHQGWGRRGDLGVGAFIGVELVGASFARLFTDDSHGHGYVDAETPEVGVGIAMDHRGRGIGRLLMNQLADVARAEGVRRLSLSVNNPNPAKRLYESLGYTLVEDDGESSIMVLEL